MATLAQSVGVPPPPLPWFWEFLKDELAPYPGRAGTVARMVIAATLVMIICMTFRIPRAFQGAVYALMISRENLRATLQSAGTMLLVTAVGAAAQYAVGGVRERIGAALRGAGKDFDALTPADLAGGLASFEHFHSLGLLGTTSLLEAAHVTAADHPSTPSPGAGDAPPRR